jgi:hypothetical protein
MDESSSAQLPTGAEEHDLLLITDATYSMDDFLKALHTSLPRIISVSELTGCFSRMGLLAYRDHPARNAIEWSGWRHQSLDSDEEQPDLVAKAKSLEAIGGGDYPEAVKTALAKAYEVMRPEATTLILLYADAPPHTNANSDGVEWSGERMILSNPDSYGGCAPNFLDWVSACNQLRKGDRKARVFSILSPYMPQHDPAAAGYFNYLSTVTRGACIYLDRPDSKNIAAVTMELLLAWMGAGSPDDSKGANDTLPAKLTRYVDITNLKQIQTEEDKNAGSFFMNGPKNYATKELIRSNIAQIDLSRSALHQHLPKKTTPVVDFSHSWSTNEAYRRMAVGHLKRIIDEDVAAISLNPVFGKLWRTICSDTTHDARDDLVNAFSLRVDRIENPEDRAAMKAWLEESYDHATEIKTMIDEVPEEKRFPCVFLDPTLNFTHPEPSDDDDEDEDANRPITSFTRAELLEIGRSCDPKILRRLGRVLTRLTYVETPAEMPAHIAAAAEVPKIPMVLAEGEYNRRFWKILLHLLVPGTLLSARPAAVLAALSLRLGIAPLTDVAVREMVGFKNKWNDVEVPENWNVSCLSLLLNADKTYRESLDHEKSETPDTSLPKKPSSLLKESDRELFEHLIAYRMLELNLDSTLTARVGWTPEKTRAPIGPVVTCRSCQYPRSVTIMGPNKKCGLCLSTEPEDLEASINTNVSKEDNENSQATWVECSARTCRAQYIVYCVDALNVRAKCHYCRIPADDSAAKTHPKVQATPWVECVRCLNRVIWPKEYRPASFVLSEYTCPHCTSGRATIAGVDIAPKKLSEENSLSWLIRDTLDPEKDPFTGRSLFNTISTIGTDKFLTRIKLFPPVDKPLTLKGKLVRNTPELISTLQGLISRRHTDRPPCSLCFSIFHPTALRPACGRRGCAQQICMGCLSGWYGLNGPGRIINTAALSCPFCRRNPSARTLAKHGMGIHAVRDLASAVREAGSWIYAWCSSCITAKPYMERVCARGMPDDLTNWECEECVQGGERARIAQIVRERNIARGINDARRIQAEIEAAVDAAKTKGIKPCPGCGTLTEKIGGCGHITCLVPKCGAHWCYFCGGKFSPALIYGHMSAAHSGFYDSDDDEYMDD